MSVWNVDLKGTAVAAGAPIPMKKWENGKMTDEAQTNAEGVPMYKIPLLYKAEGAEDYDKITVEVASAKAPAVIPDFTPVRVEGARLRVNMWTDGSNKSHLSEKISAAEVKRA